MSNPLNLIRKALFLPKQVPMILIILGITGFLCGLTLLGVIAKAKTNINKKSPPLHLWLDMDHQPKIKAQAESVVFADGRGNRLPVPGTVAQGQLDDDDHLYLGFAVDSDLTPILVDVGGVKENAWYDGMPAALFENSAADHGLNHGHDVDADHHDDEHSYPSAQQVQALLARGQERYNIYCFACHGMTGDGLGPVHKRASGLQKRSDLGTTTVWAAPANLIAVNEEGVQTFGKGHFPDGKMFDVISNGKNNMAGYRTQIPARDRWAIVAYVRALQEAGKQAAADAAKEASE